jgi:lipid-A-disaccharide synthase
MKYYIIAGERSGDLHGSNLVKSLLEEDPSAKVFGWGGDYMTEAGANLSGHYRDLAVMGFKEVILGLRKIYKYLNLVKKDIQKIQPDAIILIDFAGFNMRIAEFAKSKGIIVYYYISPKVWAWNTSRAKKIKKIVDRMFVILPFEKDFYKKFDFHVDYVGNPLVDSFYNFTPSKDFLVKHNLTNKKIIAVLPGSRSQEVENMLQVMLNIIPLFHEFQFVVAGVDNLEKKLYSPVEAHSNAQVIFNETYDLLSHAKAAMVTSGTATLETALFEVPQVAVYKTSGFSYFIARLLIQVKYISLVNLIAGKKIVEELIQKDFNDQNLKTELRKILEDREYCSAIVKSYQEIKELLGKEKASPKLARLINEYLKEKV